MIDLSYLSDSKENIDCPICNSNSSKVLYKGPAWRGKIDLTFVICTECTHLFLNPRPTLEAYEKFYVNDDYDRLICESRGKSYVDKSNLYEKDDSDFQTQAGRGRRMHDQYLCDIIGKEDIVFDFGTGDGSWLYGLREKTGCIVDGNEVSASDVDFIKEKLGVDIFLGTTEAVGDAIVEKYKNKVRVAIVSGSLQHMLDPMYCLDIAHQILRQDGYLYICNFDIFTRSLSVKSDLKLLFKELVTVDHPHLFHRNSYKYITEKSGFEIVKFNPCSTVRYKRMEIFAKKTNIPKSVTPKNNYSDILNQINDADSAVLRYRNSPFWFKKMRSIFNKVF